MEQLKATSAVAVFLFAIAGSSLACNNPLTSYLSTQTAVARTATATLWTPTPTITPTSTATPTITNTPSPMPDPRFYESAAEQAFSYLPPVGWAKDTTGDLTAWVAPDKATTLNFLVEPGDISPKQALDAVIEYLSQEEEVTVEEEGAFPNDAGLSAYRIIFHSAGFGLDVRFALYGFHQGGYLVVAAYERKNNLHKDYDTVVERSLQTLQFEDSGGGFIG